MHRYSINRLLVYAGLVPLCGVGTVWWEHMEACFTGQTPPSVPHMIFNAFSYALCALLLGFGLAHLLHKAEQKAMQQPEGVALPTSDTPTTHAVARKPLPSREFPVGMYGFACAVVGEVSFAAHFFTGRVTTGEVIVCTVLIPLSCVVGLLIVLRATKCTLVAGLEQNRVNEIGMVYNGRGRNHHCSAAFTPRRTAAAERRSSTHEKVRS